MNLFKMPVTPQYCTPLKLNINLKLYTPSEGTCGLTLQYKVLPRDTGGVGFWLPADGLIKITWMRPCV